VPNSASIHILYQTEWSVAQARSYAAGDTDVFERARVTGEDWLDLGMIGRINLQHVLLVHLSFGTYAQPNYQAVITDEDGVSVRVSGPLVLRLQDELLRRTKRHSLLDQ
jgi:hypothetical protein